ncbi:hypothetical protein RA19_00840 [Leisingera sp. ANG-M1]|uniref:SRPBCC family protein n=1 Tax=Leisingera sp. ANG-M1 TaxID=1577895 RepID=UPI00057F0748|nr:SRPBCC family protein [Leisingera sp. ANG-M1]KIC12976.1 hypothetical protein RA19_00840 [Leisingera sp. ANG-M1]
MKITKSVIVNRSADLMWKIAADEFDQAYKWMGFVHKSYRTEGGEPVQGAPMEGRVCEFTDKPNGLKAREKILSYSAENKRLVFDVVPVDTPVVFPVRVNVVTLTVKALGPERSQVTWESDVALTALGYLIYPLLKRGLAKNFATIMQELKAYAEQQVSAVAA